MTLKEKIEADLKTALLSSEKDKATLLRGLKSVILNSEIAQQKRETGLSDQEIVLLLQKEIKSRQESAELYKQGGNSERANKELDEAKIIEGYLPQQLDDPSLNSLINQAEAELGPVTAQNMGQVIGKVKQLAAGQADGARIAAAVKERIK